MSIFDHCSIVWFGQRCLAVSSGVAIAVSSVGRVKVRRMSSKFLVEF